MNLVIGHTGCAVLIFVEVVRFCIIVLLHHFITALFKFFTGIMQTVLHSKDLVSIIQTFIPDRWESGHVRRDRYHRLPYVFHSAFIHSGGRIASLACDGCWRMNRPPQCRGCLLLNRLSYTDPKYSETTVFYQYFPRHNSN